MYSAEYNGKWSAFFGLPDYNIPLKHVNGRLNWLEFSSFFGTAVRLIKDESLRLLTTRVSSENGASSLDLFRNARWNPKGNINGLNFPGSTR